MSASPPRVVDVESLSSGDDVELVAWISGSRGPVLQVMIDNQAVETEIDTPNGRSLMAQSVGILITRLTEIKKILEERG